MKESVIYFADNADIESVKSVARIMIPIGLDEPWWASVEDGVLKVTYQEMKVMGTVRTLFKTHTEPIDKAFKYLYTEYSQIVTEDFWRKIYNDTVGAFNPFEMNY